MRNRLFLSFLFFFSSICLLFSQPIVLTVADFKLESENPEYKFVGKALSRLVSGELRKSPAVKLIEREQITEVVAEQELSLSDLADAEQQIRIGRLISARYIVFGEVIDIGPALVLSLRMVDTETGEVVWQDQTTEKIVAYDYIGAYFAKSILSTMNLEAEDSTIAKIEKKEEKQAEGIVKLAEGIDAYDRGDSKKAKKVLVEAKRIDPENEVTAYYLAKLVVNTTKFSVMSEPYYTYQNPAFLGIIRTDRLFYHFSGFWAHMALGAINFGWSTSLTDTSVSADDYLSETDASLRFGYYFPVREKLGLGLECFFAFIGNDLYKRTSGDPYNMSDQVNSRLAAPGFSLNAGISVSDSVSLGLGSAFFMNKPNAFTPNEQDWTPTFSFNTGMLYRNYEETFIFDTRVGWGSGFLPSIEVATRTLGEDFLLPLFMENTLTFALNQKRTFIILKQLNDVAVDRVYYYGRILPAIEHYFVDWFSARAALEGSLSLLNESTRFGYAFLGGVSFRIIKRSLDIDLNFSYRVRPSRVVEGEMVTDPVVLFNMSWNDLWVSRE